jgi:hypothetical protein
MRIALLLLLCCAALTAFGLHAQQINRCTNAQGQTVYGDKPCEAMGARARLLPGSRTAGGSGLYHDSCARRLSEVVARIQSAVDARDANRLSSIYLWNGLSNAAATQVMDRLDAIVHRPLVDIAPVFPAEPVYEPAPPQPFTYTDGTPVEPQQGAAPEPVVDAPPAPLQPRRPIGLRLEQTLANRATPSRTVFNLRRQYNCFWITL